MLQIEGSAQLTDKFALTRHEAAIVRGPADLKVKAIDVESNGSAHVLIVEMKQI